MSRRQPAVGTRAYEPKGYSEGAAPRRFAPQLPRLPTPDVRTRRGAPDAWWQDCERLPYLSPRIPYGPRGRGTLRTLLLPPLSPSGTVRGAGTRGPRQPAPRDHPDALGALLGKFLPTKFRDFLHQLRAKCGEPEAHPLSLPQYRKGLRRPSCSFLPDLCPSGEGRRPRRRYCPFRVRFADETLQDTALRYWERSRAVRQNIFSCQLRNHNSTFLKMLP